MEGVAAQQSPAKPAAWWDRQRQLAADAVAASHADPRLAAAALAFAELAEPEPHPDPIRNKALRWRAKALAAARMEQFRQAAAAASGGQVRGLDAELRGVADDIRQRLARDYLLDHLFPGGAADRRLLERAHAALTKALRRGRDAGAGATQRLADRAGSLLEAAFLPDHDEAAACPGVPLVSPVRTLAKLVGEGPGEADALFGPLPGWSPPHSYAAARLLVAAALCTAGRLDSAALDELVPAATLKPTDADLARLLVTRLSEWRGPDTVAAARLLNRVAGSAGLFPLVRDDFSPILAEADLVNPVRVTWEPVADPDAPPQRLVAFGSATDPARIAVRRLPLDEAHLAAWRALPILPEEHPPFAANARQEAETGFLTGYGVAPPAERVREWLKQPEGPAWFDRLAKSAASTGPARAWLRFLKETVQVDCHPAIDLQTGGHFLPLDPLVPQDAAQTEEYERDGTIAEVRHHWLREKAFVRVWRAPDRRLRPLLDAFRRHRDDLKPLAEDIGRFVAALPDHPQGDGGRFGLVLGLANGLASRVPSEVGTAVANVLLQGLRKTLAEVAPVELLPSRFAFGEEAVTDLADCERKAAFSERPAGECLRLVSFGLKGKKTLVAKAVVSAGAAEPEGFRAVRDAWAVDPVADELLASWPQLALEAKGELLIPLRRFFEFLYPMNPAESPRLPHPQLFDMTVPWLLARMQAAQLEVVWPQRGGTIRQWEEQVPDSRYDNANGGTGDRIGEVIRPHLRHAISRQTLVEARFYVH